MTNPYKNWYVGLAVWAAFFLLMGFLSPGKAAGPPCGPRDAMFGELMGSKYAEVPLFEGTMSMPGVPEVAALVLANPITGTWTLAILPPNGTACLLVPGKGFKPAGAMYAPKGPPA